MGMDRNKMNPALLARVNNQMAAEDAAKLQATVDKTASSFGKLPKLAATEKVCSLKPSKRIRQDAKPLMNKLEHQFWQVLCLKYGDGNVKPQALRFRLGNGIFYKPDFVITQPDAGIVACYEVKGPFAFRGGFENLKVAASLWPTIQWVLVWREGGNWLEQVVLP